MPRTTPILDQINLVVEDMEATVAFYRRLGIEVPDTQPQWQADHRNATMPDGISLDFDSVPFAAQWNSGMTPASGRARAVIGFRVETREDVDAIYGDMTSAGYRGQQPPYDAFWGARYAIIEDPDGNAIGLMSPRDPARRQPPPSP